MASDNSEEVNKATKSFVCYFCNKEIVNDTEFGHMTVCGRVLVPCTFKCGIYVPRSEMNHHESQCPKNMKGNNINTLTNGSIPSRQFYGTLTKWDETPLNTLDSQKHLQSSVKSLQNRCRILEQHFSQLVSKNNSISDKSNLDNLKHQITFIENWKNTVDFKLDHLKQELIKNEIARIESNNLWTNLHSKLVTIEKLGLELNSMKENFAKGQEMCKQTHAQLQQNINSLADHSHKENSILVDLWNDNKSKMEDLQQNLQNSQDANSVQKAKFANVDFDVKAVTRIATEVAEKFEIQQRDFEVMKIEFEQMKIDLELLEEPSSLMNCTGRLLWKVTNFESKFEKAKENNLVLKSPIFYTHDYGYKIRVLLYLNGLNKWKDRYSLLSFHVLTGEYDNVLKWPCFIEGTITLKDIENLEDPKNFSKYISAKRTCGDGEYEDPQESSSTYIFIPHTTLKKSTYIKNNTLFFDILINQNSKLKFETDF